MMLLGKRPRPPIRRTASMTGITVNLTNNVEQSEASDNFENPFRDHHLHETGDYHIAAGGGGGVVNGFDHQYYTSSSSSNNIMSTVSPRNPRRNSSDHSMETAHFLRTCGLCKRRLSSGRDIYMYRGDTAFCSQECREQQMKQDERKERNCSVPATSEA